MGHSCKKSPQPIKMMKLTILSILLCSLVSSTPVPSNEEQARGLLQDILIGQIQNQINGLLGITTTRGTPVLDVVGGLLGGETRTEAPAAENANLIQTLLGLLFPTTTTTTTTTAAPTTTKCGGLIGGGLLC